MLWPRLQDVVSPSAVCPMLVAFFAASTAPWTAPVAAPATTARMTFFARLMIVGFVTFLLLRRLAAPREDARFFDADAVFFRASFAAGFFLAFFVGMLLSFRRRSESHVIAF